MVIRSYEEEIQKFTYLQNFISTPVVACQEPDDPSTHSEHMPAHRQEPTGPIFFQTEPYNFTGREP